MIYDLKNEQERNGNESSVNSLKKRFTNPLTDHSGGMKWQKVMDLCTKNTNCLQVNTTLSRTFVSRINARHLKQDRRVADDEG